MPATIRTDHHVVFPAEERGDTLVVTPKGDVAGFSHTDVIIELRTIQKLLKQPEIKHLIVDLHGASYFGSEMIGLINSLGLAARQGGGRIAVCRLSNDMLGILRVMNFELLWEFYRDRNEALRAIATVSLSRQLKRVAKWMIVPAMAATAALVLFNIPESNIDKRRYEMLMNLARELKQVRQQPQSKSMREELFERAGRKLKITLVQLQQEIQSQRDDEAAVKRHLYFAARECLLPMLQNGGVNMVRLEDEFNEHMTQASKHIDGVFPPEPDPGRSTASTATDSANALEPQRHTSVRSPSVATEAPAARTASRASDAIRNPTRSR